MSKNTNQWQRDALERRLKSLAMLTTMLFEDIEVKSQKIAEVEKGLSVYVQQAYELQKKIEAKTDAMQNLVKTRDHLQQQHDQAARESKKVLDELELHGYLDLDKASGGDGHAKTVGQMGA